MAEPAAPGVRIALAFLCILVVWGTTYLAIAIVLRDLPPFLSAAMRFLLAAALLYGLLRLRGPKPLAGLPARTVIVSGVLLCGLGNGFTVFAMQGVPSGIAALLNSTIPICVTLLDWGFFNRRRPRIWTGIGLEIAARHTQTEPLQRPYAGGYIVGRVLEPVARAPPAARFRSRPVIRDVGIVAPTDVEIQERAAIPCIR